MPCARFLWQYFPWNVPVPCARLSWPNWPKTSVCRVPVFHDNISTKSSVYSDPGLHDTMGLKRLFVVCQIFVTIFPIKRLCTVCQVIGNKISPEIECLCEGMMNASIAAYGTAFIPIHIFHWIHQRIFYPQPFLWILYTTQVRCLSWCLIISFCR